jgi:hypothetical protein
MEDESPQNLPSDPSPDLVDIRDLTFVGMFFGVISICIVIGGAFAIYHFQPFPRLFGLQIHGTGPAILCGIPLAGVTAGFFKASAAVCETLGIPFSHGRFKRRLTNAAVNVFPESRDDFPCSLRTFMSRLDEIDRSPVQARLILPALVFWGIPVMVVCVVGFDKWIGARANGFTDLLYICLSSLLAFGPAGFLIFLAKRANFESCRTLTCPACSHRLIGASATELIATKRCPGCHDLLLIE